MDLIGLLVVVLIYTRVCCVFNKYLFLIANPYIFLHKMCDSSRFFYEIARVLTFEAGFRYNTFNRNRCSHMSRVNCNDYNLMTIGEYREFRKLKKRFSKV